MADTARKIVVPKEQLPPVNAEFNAYFLRYRIVSEDKNLSSEWSAIHEVSTDKIYSASGQGNISYSPETQQITASWPLQEGIADYDVWYKWSAISPAVLPTNTRAITAASLNNTTGEILYTTGSYGGSVATHLFNVGDIVTINGCVPTQYNLRDYVVTSVPNRTSFTIKNKAYIGQTIGSITSPGYAYLETWKYEGRIAGNTVNFYQNLPTDVRFSIRVYTPHYPISHNENYLIFAYLDKVT